MFPPVPFRHSLGDTEHPITMRRLESELALNRSAYCTRVADRLFSVRKCNSERLPSGCYASLVLWRNFDEWIKTFSLRLFCLRFADS